MESIGKAPRIRASPPPEGLEHPGTLLKSERVEIVLHAVAAAATDVHAAIFIKVRLFIFKIYMLCAKCVNYNNPYIAVALFEIKMGAI